MIHPYLFLATAILGSFIVPTSSLCSMYAVCHETAAYFNYCPANSETVIPKPLPEESRQLEDQLKMKCPYLFADNNRDLCCDAAQVEALFKMISIATSLFSRCPSCMDNFWKYWCMYTCSPSQADYLKVLETEPSPTTNRSMVIKVQYNLSRQYAEGTYESCKDVKLASAAGNAMLIMCGRLAPNETCTLNKWLSFMGTRSAGLGVPVDILHEYHDNNSPGNFMHMNTSRCDQSPRVGQSKCMISDCPVEGKKVHFRLEEGGTQEICTLFGLGCSLYFLVFSVFIFCSVLAWAVLPSMFQRKNIREVEFDLDSSISSQAHWIPKQIHLNSVLFVEFVSKQPFLTLTTAIFLAVICCTGILFLEVTSSPLEVWVPPNSRAIQEKEYFDSHFGPFYRIQQVIMYPKNGKIAPISSGIGPVFKKDFMKEVFNVMNVIFDLEATVSDGKRVKLEDICYRPMGAGYDCLVNSPTNFFQHNISLLDQEVTVTRATTGNRKEDEEEFDYDEKDVEKEGKEMTYLDHLMECIGNPYTLTTSFGQSCIAPYGGPTFPYLVFGNENGQSDHPLNSTAAIISIPLSSKADVGKMRAWEKSFIKMMKKYKHENVQLSFLAERSIQDEIRRASESDAITVLITLLLMILYSVFALGQYKAKENKLASILVQSKIIVGFCGIFSIFTAIASSLGILAFYGLRIPSAAIVMNSFVTLLIGCNRIFAVVWTSRNSLKRQWMDFSVSHAFKTSLPSSLMCTMVQSTVFFTGAFISVPAVRSFCLLASLSIILQMFFLCVLFLPICIWDLRRQQSNRPEFACFTNCTSTISEKEDILDEKTVKEGNFPLLRKLPIVSSMKSVQVLTILVTITILAALPWASSELRLGLDQKLAVPKDSYMYTHFTNIEKYMNIGPPVYFVVQGDIDFSRKSWQNKFCSIGGCSDSSIAGILSQASANSERSYITGETLNWLDTYLDWLAPESQCCKTFSDFSSPISRNYCRSNDKNCTSCDSFKADGRPSESIFYRHLNQFLEDVPSAQCVKGGRAAYHDALHLDSNGHIDASHFMTFHVPLRNSSSYIHAMISARLLAQKMEQELGENVKVFPYSVFYVFYEQFSTIRTVSAYQLIFAFTAIFLATFLLIGFDAFLAFIMIFVCSFQLTSQIVFMVLFHIDLNSISAVNLVLAVAICVEYCLPLLTAYSASKLKNNLQRAEEAVEAVAPASLWGLTVPMILGTGMLTFAQSPFFNVYFFRMLIVTALTGSFSGLLLLPVLLSLSAYCKTRARKPSLASELREIFEEAAAVENLHPLDPVQRAPLLTTVL